MFDTLVYLRCLPYRNFNLFLLPYSTFGHSLCLYKLRLKLYRHRLSLNKHSLCSKVVCGFCMK